MIVVRHVWADVLDEWWLAPRAVAAALWPAIRDAADRRRRDGARFDHELDEHLTAVQWLADRERAAQLAGAAARAAGRGQQLAPAAAVWRGDGCEYWRVPRRVVAALERTVASAIADLRRDRARLEAAGVSDHELVEHLTAVQWLANRQRALESCDLDDPLPELDEVPAGWCGADEAARMLDVSVRTIRRWANAGILPSEIEDGRRRGRRYPLAELDRIRRQRLSRPA